MNMNETNNENEDDQLLQLTMYKCPLGNYYFRQEDFPENSKVDFLNVQVTRDDVTRTYPVFRQGAMMYGNYSDYMAQHGCACCNLTAILTAYCKEFRNYMPQDIIANVEQEVFTPTEWTTNYGKDTSKQMPVSLKGISRILDYFHISHRYIPEFQDRHVRAQIMDHLLKGKPVVIEVSRVRYKGHLPVSITDRKYAGSYHTMTILGIEEDGDTVWVIDSAYRAWSGSAQRLKRTSLTDLTNYMFPSRFPYNERPYFVDRKHTGGFLLIDE